MRVGHDHLRGDPLQRAQRLHRALQHRQRLEVGRVADVLAEPRRAPARHAHGGLELASHGQHRGAGHGQGQGHRRVAPAAAHRLRRPGHHAGDGVVAGHVDGPVVVDEHVREARQALLGLGRVDADRLVGEVPAGHHEEVGGTGVEQQVVQGGVGEHHAEGPGAGCHVGDEVGVERGEDHDRPGRGGEQRLGRAVDDGHLTCRGQVGGHEGERLGPTLLAGAQRRHSRRIAGVTGEVVAADALDRHDPPRPECLRPPRRRASTAGARTPGRRSAGRGTAGWSGRCTRPGTVGTAGIRPWWCSRRS